MPTVKEVGYMEFRKLLQERYGKSWMQWIMGVCPTECIWKKPINGGFDETAANWVGYQRLQVKMLLSCDWNNEVRQSENV